MNEVRFPFMNVQSNFPVSVEKFTDKAIKTLSKHPVGIKIMEFAELRDSNTREFLDRVSDVSFRPKSGEISYTLPGRYTLYDLNTKKIRLDNRDSFSIEYFLKEKFGRDNAKYEVSITMSEIYDFIDQVTEYEIIETDFEDAYDCDNYENDLSSCMTKFYDRVGEFYNNFDVVPLVYTVAGKYYGRALLWTLENGTQYLDRVYTENSACRTAFKKYAEKNDIPSYDWSPLYKKHNIYSKVVMNDDDFFPYLDTFCYIDEGLSMISNKKFTCGYPLDSTVGELKLDNRVETEDGQMIDPDEAVETENGEIYHVDDTVTTVHGEVYHYNDIRIARLNNDEFALTTDNNVYWIEDQQEYVYTCYPRDNYVYVEREHLWYSKDYEHIYFIVNSNEYICSYNTEHDHIVKIDGDWYYKHGDDIFYDETDAEYKLWSNEDTDNYVNIEGKFYQQIDVSMDKFGPLYTQNKIDELKMTKEVTNNDKIG